MISFFTSLKPFLGSTAVQQRNALLSWSHTDPYCEIIIFGAIDGGRDTVADIKATYRPDVACNEYGTPLISAMFAEAQRIGRYSVLCYINGDIILLPDFAAAVGRLAQWKIFAAIGRRWDLDWQEPVDFGQSQWDKRMRDRARAQGKRHDPVAMDFFAFRRGAIGPLPEFAIGRPAWDNYLVKHLLSRRIPIVDLSPVVTPVHQNHDYAHVAGGSGVAWEGPEADHNRRLAALDFWGFNPSYYSITNAQWVMYQQCVFPALAPRRAIWRLLALCPDRCRDWVAALLSLPRRLARRAFRQIQPKTNR